MMTNVQNAVRYAIGKTIDEDHPRMEMGHCLDIKKKTKPCGICSEICPTGATLGARDHNWDACIDCNLCVSACPTRSIRASANVMDKLLHAIEADAAEITVSCEQNEGDAYLQLYCMGDIPWEVLATCALDKRLVLNTSLCHDCVETAGKAQLIAMLRKTREFLGADFFDEHIKLTREPSSSGFSRREAVDMIRGISKNLAGNMLNRAEGGKIDGLFFRKALADRLGDPKPEDPTYTLHTVEFNDNCWACNICKNICPERAIDVEKDKDEGEYTMIHRPWLCVTCGLCKAVCKDDAIDGYFSFKTSDPLTPLATPAHPQVCEKCGSNYRPDGTTVCLRCRRAEERRIENERRKAETQARLEKMKAERAAKLAAEKTEKAAEGSGESAE